MGETKESSSRKRKVSPESNSQIVEKFTNQDEPSKKKKAKKDSVPVAPPKPEIQYARISNQLPYLERLVCVDLWKHPKSWPFLAPVDPQKLQIPDYFDIIKKPMDLGTIKGRLESGYYKKAEDCISDIELVFSNCYEYNKPESDVSEVCRQLERGYRKKIAAMPQELTVSSSLHVGMRLEMEDPENSQVCCATIRDIHEDYVLIHFDGWEHVYDFWCHPWDERLHAVGWCLENEVPLSPPKSWKNVKTFTWESYLQKKKAEAVTSAALIPAVVPYGFAPGMKLEVEDRENSQNCCATVAAVDPATGQLCIHFDGWETDYDIWCHLYSSIIHPVGWCREKGKALSPPKDWADVKNFTWEAYLKQTHCLPVPKAAFQPKLGLAKMAPPATVQDTQTESQDAWKNDIPPDVKPAVKTFDTTPALLGIKSSVVKSKTKQQKAHSKSTNADSDNEDTLSTVSAVSAFSISSTECPDEDVACSVQIRRRSNNSLSSAFSDKTISHLSPVTDNSPCNKGGISDTTPNTSRLHKGPETAPVGSVKVGVLVVDEDKTPVNVSDQVMPRKGGSPLQASRLRLQQLLTAENTPPSTYNTYKNISKVVKDMGVNQSKNQQSKVTAMPSKSPRQVKEATDTEIPMPVFPPDVVYNRNNEPMFMSRLTSSTSSNPVSPQAKPPIMAVQPITIEPIAEMRVTERINTILSNVQMLGETEVRSIIQIASSRLHPHVQIELAQMFMRWNHDILPHTNDCTCMNFKPKPDN